MIHRFGLQRPDQADFVRNLRGVGQNFAQFHPPLTVLREFELRSQQCGIRIDERGSITLQQFSGR
jgi:hypothetical protein